MSDLCHLCQPSFTQKTKWHYDGELYAIIDCLKCLIPMVVLRAHIDETKVEDKLIQDIAKKCTELFEHFSGFKKDAHGTMKPHVQWHIMQDK